MEASRFEDDQWCYTILVTNGWVSESIELRMSDAVAKSWVDGADTPPPDAMVAEHVAVMLRSASWAKVQQAALRPRTVVAGRLRH